MSDAATLITAIATIITACTALASVLVNGRRIKDVRTEVKTANSLTIAQLADNTESRRIDKIPFAEQTSEEKTHLAEIPRKEV